MLNSRTTTLQALAADILAASGIDPKRQTTRPQRLALARELAKRGKCHISTAKHHIARAMRRARHPDWQPPQHGGARPGAGRPKKVSEPSA